MSLIDLLWYPATAVLIIDFYITVKRRPIPFYLSPSTWRIFNIVSVVVILIGILKML